MIGYSAGMNPVTRLISLVDRAANELADPNSKTAERGARFFDPFMERGPIWRSGLWLMVATILLSGIGLAGVSLIRAHRKCGPQFYLSPEGETVCGPRPGEGWQPWK